MKALISTKSLKWLKSVGLVSHMLGRPMSSEAFGGLFDADPFLCSTPVHQLVSQLS